jgi:hypothetical protein
LKERLQTARNDQHSSLLQLSRAESTPGSQEQQQVAASFLEVFRSQQALKPLLPLLSKLYGSNSKTGSSAKHLPPLLAIALLHLVSELQLQNGHSSFGPLHFVNSKFLSKFQEELQHGRKVIKSAYQELLHRLAAVGKQLGPLQDISSSDEDGAATIAAAATAIAIRTDAANLIGTMTNNSSSDVLTSHRVSMERGCAAAPGGAPEDEPAKLQVLRSELDGIAADLALLDEYIKENYMQLGQMAADYDQQLLWALGAGQAEAGLLVTAVYSHSAKSRHVKYKSGRCSSCAWMVFATCFGCSPCCLHDSLVSGSLAILLWHMI